MRRGYVQHLDSRLFVHPQGGHGKANTSLVLHPGGLWASGLGTKTPKIVGEDRLVWNLHADGSLEHAESGGARGLPRMFSYQCQRASIQTSPGLFVHPKGGRAKEEVPLILHPGGHERRLAFELTKEGNLRHIETNVGDDRAVEVPVIVIPYPILGHDCSSLSIHRAVRDVKMAISCFILLDRCPVSHFDSLPSNVELDSETCAALAAQAIATRRRDASVVLLVLAEYEVGRLVKFCIRNLASDSGLAGGARDCQPE